MLFCCFLTSTLVKNLESVVTQRFWSPRKIRKSIYNQNSSGKYYAFPPKNARYGRRRTNECKGPMCKLNSHGRGYPLNHSKEFPRSHNQITRGYKLQQLGCLHRMNRTVIVSIDERACGLECVRATTRGHAVNQEQSNQKQKKTNINDRPSFPGYLAGCRAATTPVPCKLKFAVGRSPHEGYTTLVQTLQKSAT